jgi:hypothetical protein
LLGAAGAAAATAAALQELMEQVPPRLRRRCRTMRAAMVDGGYPTREVIAVLRAMFAPPAEAATFDQALRDAYSDHPYYGGAYYDGDAYYGYTYHGYTYHGAFE